MRRTRAFGAVVVAALGLMAAGPAHGQDKPKDGAKYELRYTAADGTTPVLAENVEFPALPKPKARPLLFVNAKGDGNQYDDYAKIWIDPRGQTSFKDALDLPENDWLDLEPYYVQFSGEDRSLTADAENLGRAIARIIKRQDTAFGVDYVKESSRVAVIAFGQGALTTRQLLKQLHYPAAGKTPPLKFNPISEFVALSPRRYVADLSGDSERVAVLTELNTTDAAPGSRANGADPSGGTLYVSLYAHGGRDLPSGVDGRGGSFKTHANVVNIEVARIPIGNRLEVHRATPHTPDVISLALHTVVHQEAPVDSTTPSAGYYTGPKAGFEYVTTPFKGRAVPIVAPNARPWHWLVGGLAILLLLVLLYRALWTPAYRKEFTADQLMELTKLDEAKWFATNAPVKSFNYFKVDPTFVDLLDVDKDGRIRAGEVRGAVEWTLAAVKEDALETDGPIDKASRTLHLDSLRDTSTGNEIRDAAKKHFNSDEIKLENVRDAIFERLQQRRHKKRIVFAKSVNDKDKRLVDVLKAPVIPGVKSPKDALSVQDIRWFLTDIVASVGGAGGTDRGNGVRAMDLQLFVKEINEYYRLFPNGSCFVPDENRFTKRSPETRALMPKLRDKLNEFFALCNASERPPPPKLADGSTEIRSLLESAPLATPEKKGTPEENAVLEFEKITNRYFKEPLKRFRKEVLSEFLRRQDENLEEVPDPPSMTEETWDRLEADWNTYETWSARPGVDVGLLGNKTLRKYRDRLAEYERAVKHLVEKRKDSAKHLGELQLVERFILHQANILRFVNSYVVVPYLFKPDRRALFEFGTLIMDGRHFNFCTKVLDRTRHAAYSKASKMFVIYATVSKANHPLFEVAAPVTSGSRGDLKVGSVGIFESVALEHFHAEIVHIVENPTSLGAAMLAPFLSIGRALAEKLEKMTKDPVAALEATKAKVLAGTGSKGAAPSASSPGAGASLLAGGGIAVAALGTSLTLVIEKVSDFSRWEIVGGLLGVVVMIGLPAAIAAWLKLRQRDLGAVLTGAGWGINVRMNLIRPQRKAFSHEYRPLSKLAAWEREQSGSTTRKSCDYCNWKAAQTKAVRGRLTVKDRKTGAPVSGVNVAFSRYPVTVKTDFLGQVDQTMKLPIVAHYLKATLTHPDYETRTVRAPIDTDPVYLGNVDGSAEMKGDDKVVKLTRKPVST